MNLTLSNETVGTWPVLSVQGEVDVHSAPTLRERIQSMLDAEHTGLVVDLSSISFIDSTGLGVLVSGQNRARELGGELRLICPQERVLKLFRITGLDGVFAIHADRATATATA